jgi:hypothetical protein
MIYTFYSFKGGVGRSMALANVAELFYRKGLKVLVVDFDLEAPGLERFFNVPHAVLSPDEILSRRGILDMLLSYKELRSLDRRNSQKASQADSRAPLASSPSEPLTTFISPIYEDAGDLNPMNTSSVTNDTRRGSLSIISAGRRDGNQFANYAKGLRSFDWDDFYANWEGERFFESFRQQAEEIADVVLIDSRTGVTEMSGVCTYQLADVVVMFVAPNEQNLNGILMMTRSLANPELVELGRNGRNLSLLFVPSRVEGAESDSLTLFAQEFQATLGQFFKPDLKFEKGFFLDLKIPYVPYYAYNENIAVREPERLTNNEMIDAYDRLTSTLIQFVPIGDKLYRAVRGVGFEAPGGTMNPQSPFYVEREPEDSCAKESVLRNRVTITIKGTRQVGKSSLLSRLMGYASKAGKRVVLLDFQQIEKETLKKGTDFFKQFCSWITDKLELEDQVEEYWKKSLSNPQICTSYLGRHILPQLTEPLMVAMDEVDVLFDSDFRSDFFGMVRSWHNDRALEPIWTMLDIVLVTAVEPFELIDDLNQSPFNVGEIIALSDFEAEHVARLNQLYGSPLTSTEESRLMDLLGGHPYLTHRAIYGVAVQGIPVSDLFLPPMDDNNPFSEHLRKIPYRLREEEGLMESLLQIVRYHKCSDERASLRLQGAGFVRREGRDVVVPRCRLYSTYLKEYLNVQS